MSPHHITLRNLRTALFCPPIPPHLIVLSALLKHCSTLCTVHLLMALHGPPKPTLPNDPLLEIPIAKPMSQKRPHSSTAKCIPSLSSSSDIQIKLQRYINSMSHTPPHSGCHVERRCRWRCWLGMVGAAFGGIIAFELDERVEHAFQCWSPRAC